MQRILLSILLIVTVGCSKEDLSVDKGYVKARVMFRSCGGTVLQFVNLNNGIGKEWLWVQNLEGPFDASNPAQVYSGCVSAFEIPTKRQTIGDTLEFTYGELSGPPGVVCAIGGLPTVYITIKDIRNK